LYSLVLTTTHTNTLGELLLHITASGADPADYWFQISTYIPGEAATLQADQAVNATKFAGQTITAAAGVTLPSSVASPTNITAATGVVLSSAGVQAIWDALTSALTTVGSIGKRLVDNLTGDIYARLGSPAGASVSADVAAILRKDSAIGTDNATEVTAINANGGSGAGAFDNTTDAQEALRDRGDAAWTTVAAAAIRSAVGLGSANLDTQLAAIDSDVQASAQPGDAMTLTSGERDNVAAAVRDVSNSSPAAGSLGEAARNADAKGSILIATIGTPAGATVSDDIAAVPTANQNADAYLDRADAIETGLTPREAQRLQTSALAGKLSGNGTSTVTLRNVGDTKDRIVATIDGNKNRTAVSTDVS
jgi:hypothetical protein